MLLISWPCKVKAARWVGILLGWRMKQICFKEPDALKCFLMGMESECHSKAHGNVGEGEDEDEQNEMV